MSSSSSLSSSSPSQPASSSWFSFLGLSNTSPALAASPNTASSTSNTPTSARPSYAEGPTLGLLGAGDSNTIPINKRPISTPSPSPQEREVQAQLQAPRQGQRAQSRTGIAGPAHHRLSLPAAERLLTTTLIAGTLGFWLGAAAGSRRAAGVFLAENSHRLPQTRRGWYSYHRAKNYVRTLGGMREGARMGLRVAGGSLVFFAAEEAFDRWRTRHTLPPVVVVEVEDGQDGAGRQLRLAPEFSLGQVDALSTTGAGMALAALFSLSNRLPASYAARVCKMGLLVGASYGVLQDLLKAGLQGQSIAWIDWLARRLRSGS